MDTYQNLVSRISRLSSLSEEEITKRIEAKRAKLSGLISKEGAAQIVAAEIGVSFESERLKLSELAQGMKRVNIIGKITKLNPVREFTKNDRKGKVCSFQIGDESANIRSVLWDENHIKLVEKGEIKEGDVIEISNGNVRNGELHLTGFSDIKKSNEKIENVKEIQTVSSGTLKNAMPGNNLKIKAVVVQVFALKIDWYSACIDSLTGPLGIIVLVPFAQFGE